MGVFVALCDKFPFSGLERLHRGMVVENHLFSQPILDGVMI